MSTTYLTEVTRMQMIQAAKSKSPDRFVKRLNYNTKQFKDVDFKRLFEDDTFLWYAAVGDHMVILEFDGAFEELKWLTKGMKGPNKIKRLTREIVTKALNLALDESDLRVACACSDWSYRFRFYAVEKGYSADPASNKYHYRPKYARTNKDDNKGYVCKHILAVLYGKRWVPAAAKAWLEWMQANPELTSEYLFSEKYLKDRERKKQQKLSINIPKDEEELKNDTDQVHNADATQEERDT